MPFYSAKNQQSAYPKVAMLALFIIFVLGLMLRLQAVTFTEIDTPVRADALKYTLYAYNLNNFGVYTNTEDGIQGHPEQLKPDAFVTPGYPLFLSLFVGQGFSDSQYYHALLVQAVLSALVIIFAYILFAELGWIWALFISLCVAFSPHLVSASTYLLTETLFCFFLIAFLATCSRLNITTNQWLFFITGLLLGLATLTRPWTQLFVVLLSIMLITSLDKKRITGTLWLFFGFACVISPWLIRNYLVLGMVTDPSISIYSFQHGMYPDMMYNFMPESRGFPYRFDPWVLQNTVLSSQAVLDELYRRIQENPWVYLEWYTIGKLQTVFSWSILGGVGDVFIYPVIKTPYATSSYFQATHYFIYTLHNSFVVLSLIATVFAWLPLAKRVIPATFLFTFRVLSLFMIYFMILHMIGAPFPRYSVPMRPVIYGLAVVMLAVCWNYIKILYQQRMAKE